MSADTIDPEVYEDLGTFISFIQNDFNKQLIISTIDSVINIKSSWPANYYTLRDDTLPNIIGIKNAQFLDWFILTGFVQLENVIEREFSEDEPFLKFLFYNYSHDFWKAKLCNMNPLGYFGLKFTTHDKENFNSYLTRNDGEVFLLRTDLNGFLTMIHEQMVYLGEMVHNDALKVYNEDEILSRLDAMKETLHGLEIKINEDMGSEHEEDS
ncbi:hypothetical protein MOB09_14240 [Bacillus vallismortis]|uniref:hypothetical protein n=1 Tax=Bacillus vallismortis TaxID=72361 RepID=UPI00227E510C|nr:hypothetical protein [Bacillus vallismortis]MCY7894147.1 hypothetical protein [Bacillus vallismortis]